MTVTKYFIRKKIQALSAAAAARTHCYRSIEDIRSVLIMGEAKDWDVLKACIGHLKTIGKLVHVCIYVKKQDETPIWDYAYLLVGADDDIDMWGFPKRNICRQLNGLSSDVLVDFTDKDLMVMRYLVLQHPATFKVGAKYETDSDTYDLSIVMKDDVHDIPFLYRQILKYLQAIRSK